MAPVRTADVPTSFMVADIAEDSQEQELRLWQCQWEGRILTWCVPGGTAYIGPHWYCSILMLAFIVWAGAGQPTRQPPGAVNYAMTIVCLLLFLRCALSNPGILKAGRSASRDHIIVDEAGEETVARSCACGFQLPLEAQFCCQCGRPASEATPVVVARAAPARRRQWNYCDTCNLDQPVGCTHCNFCGVCIEGYDHHCVWMGKCIGRGNICAFYTFVCVGMGCLAYLFMFPQ